MTLNFLPTVSPFAEAEGCVADLPRLRPVQGHEREKFFNFTVHTIGSNMITIDDEAVLICRSLQETANGIGGKQVGSGNIYTYF